MGERLTVRACALTNAGKKRENNEDSFYFDGTVSRMNTKEQFIKDKNRDAAQIYAIFDGVGGEAHGEIASNTAAHCLSACVKRFEKSGGTVIDLVNTFINEANEALVKKAQEMNVSVIASTCVVACVFGEKLFVLNVGDSKGFYITADGVMSCITKEHIASSGEEKGALTRCLGLPAENNRMTPYFSKAIEPKPGDTLVLCSDGLTDMIGSEAIGECVRQNSASDAICKKLCEMALSEGGNDNITIITLRF